MDRIKRILKVLNKHCYLTTFVIFYLLLEILLFGSPDYKAKSISDFFINRAAFALSAVFFSIPVWVIIRFIKRKRHPQKKSPSRHIRNSPPADSHVRLAAPFVPRNKDKFDKHAGFSLRREKSSPPPQEPQPGPFAQPAAAPSKEFFYRQKKQASKETDRSLVRYQKYPLESLTALRGFRSYVVLDTETTGINRATDRIVDIAILTVQDGRVVERFESLVNPKMHIPAEASKVNGIYDRDVADAPTITALADAICDRLAGQVVVGHNIVFDLGILTRQLAKPLAPLAPIPYVDTIALAKRALPGCENYKLETLSRLIGHTGPQAHRALADTELCNDLLTHCVGILIAEQQAKNEQKKQERAQQDADRRRDFAWSPLLDKTFAFTGDFSAGREYVESLVPQVGALVRENVSGKLDYLVVGDVSSLPDWALERKLKKADALIAEGKPLQKLTENEFIRLVMNVLSTKPGA